MLTENPVDYSKLPVEYENLTKEEYKELERQWLKAEAEFERQILREDIRESLDEEYPYHDESDPDD